MHGEDGQDDLLGHADLRTQSPTTNQGAGMLLDHEDEAGISSGLATLDIGLLQPEIRTSPLPAPTEFATLSGAASSMPPAMVLGGFPSASTSNAVALSSGYTGLSALVSSSGLPSAMMGSPQKPGFAPVSAPGVIPGGNQRMMMQPSQQPATGAMGSGQGAGPGQPMVFSSQPPAVDGEYRTPMKVLLRPEMGGGLSVALVLRNGVPAVTMREAFSAFLALRNVGDQLLRFVARIGIVYFCRIVWITSLPIRSLSRHLIPCRRRVKVNLPADIKRTTIPEVTALAPGEESWIPLEIALGDLNGEFSLSPSS
jgi:hypothetical protein